MVIALLRSIDLQLDAQVEHVFGEKVGVGVARLAVEDFISVPVCKRGG